jgi:hypothetical protein
VVINLAGPHILDVRRRWNDAYRQEVLHSRVETTRSLVHALNAMERPPLVFVSTAESASTEQPKSLRTLTIRGSMNTRCRWASTSLPNSWRWGAGGRRHRRATNTARQRGHWRGAGCSGT